MSPARWRESAPLHQVLAEPDEHAAGAIAYLLALPSASATPEAFLSGALSHLANVFHADFASVSVADQGNWHSAGQFGRGKSLPGAFLADVLDRGEVGSSAIEGTTWLAAPLERRRATAPVVCLSLARGANSGADETLELFAKVVSALDAAWSAVLERADQSRRVVRLQTLLECSVVWNQSQDMETLLQRMAESAARLLEADRASIFLRDRGGKQLVGSPALGLPSGELRVADDAGVVGRVLKTGRPERVHDGHQQQLIARDVDAQLGYRTKSLACVPLNGRDGQRFGVFEVINKKRGVFSEDDLEALGEIAAHASIALENTREREALLESRRKITEEAAQHVRIIGKSPAIEALRSTVSRVAATDLAVLVLGENGTGKEVVSQLIHYQSPRRDQPFIAVNCAAISETLLESELFGHEKGAFTDAHETRRGKFELASGGTIFLDEIGDLSLGGQAKLLRVLEEKVVVRVGGSKLVHTDARVVAATNQDLPQMVREKRFRQDLYFRLNVVSVELPPLRERGDDVLILAEHFLESFCRSARRKRPFALAEGARKRLRSHPWPGNVRELRNLMERLAYLHQGDDLDEADLVFASSKALLVEPTAPAPRAVQADRPLGDATDAFQREYIQAAVHAARGNMSDAARTLGLHRSNLYRKMRQLDMSEALAEPAAEE